MSARLQPTRGALARAARSCARPALAIAFAAALTGCAQPPKPLYGWESYQGQVYAHFKGSDSGPPAQAAALEADLQKIKARGAQPGPGFHAHLGLLYLGMGQDAQALQHLEAEKALFPESAQYIDFLLAKSKK